MKKRDLIMALKALGFWQAKGGAKHEKWTNGYGTQMVGRHGEIGEMTARGILKDAAEAAARKLAAEAAAKGEKS